MKKSINALLSVSLAVLTALALSGCNNYDDILNKNLETTSTVSVTETSVTKTETSTNTETEPTETSTDTEQTETTEETTFTETTAKETVSTTQTTQTETTASPETTSLKTEKTTVTETAAEKLSVEKDGSYTTPEDVAEYIHTFGTLPKNFITKAEAKELGWDNKKGNLWDVAPNKSIGGDYFGNYEGLLPKAKGRKYTECDVNYEGGYRGSERIIFSNDGLIYYTNDHYQTFTQLY